MKLSKHIELHYNGNVAAFARDQGLHRTQVDRYLAAGAIWLDNAIWTRTTRYKLTGNDKVDDAKTDTNFY